MKRTLLVGIPVFLLALSLYLAGLRLYQQRSVPVSAPQTDFPAQGKTPQEEDSALREIGDQINLNTATQSELMLLDGIGEVLARRILDKREELGGFTSPRQLLDVEGIGPALFEEIENYIKVE